MWPDLWLWCREGAAYYVAAEKVPRWVGEICPGPWNTRAVCRVSPEGLSRVSNQSLSLRASPLRDRPSVCPVPWPALPTDTSLETKEFSHQLAFLRAPKAWFLLYRGGQQALRKVQSPAQGHGDKGVGEGKPWTPWSSGRLLWLYQMALK